MKLPEYYTWIGSDLTAMEDWIEECGGLGKGRLKICPIRDKEDNLKLTAHGFPDLTIEFIPRDKSKRGGGPGPLNFVLTCPPTCDNGD